MRRWILIIFSLAFYQISNSQIANRFDWDLQYNNTKIHLNNSDIGIWIRGLDEFMDRVSQVKIVADKHPEFIKGNFISFQRGSGALIKLNILSNHNLIGYYNKLLIIDESQDTIMGHIIIPIGSDPPIINAYDSRGQLPVGGDFQEINLHGTDLDGITNVESDGTVIIQSINSRSRNNQLIPIQIKANTNSYSNNTSFKCKYYEFDPISKMLIERITGFFNTNVSIYTSSVIELEPTQKDIYVTDIINNNLSIRINNRSNSSGSVDFSSLRIVPQEILDQNSSIRLSNSNDGELNLIFRDVNSLKDREVYIEFEPTTRLNITNNKYRVGINLLPEPDITTIENDKGDQSYIINQNLEQIIMVSGKDVDNVNVVPTNTNLFEVVYLSADPSRKEFLLKLKSNNFPAKSYNFQVFRDKNLLKTFSLTFEAPKIPQKIKTLVSLNNGGKDYPTNSSNKDISIDSKSNNFKLTLKPDSLKAGYGIQSLNIKINYYNTDNSLIASVDELNNGNSAIIIREGGNPYVVELNVKDNFNDYIRPWGRAEIIISHTADYYKQRLDLKEVHVQRINFIRKYRTSITASLTIPPALMIYGKDSKHRVELLPINVGFGLNFSFRKDESHSYAKNNFEIGAYLAGLNFAGTSSLVQENEGDANFINKGDIAFMALGQIDLRRTDNFVKIPILFGPGITFPINGATSKVFIALGVGVNF